MESAFKVLAGFHGTHSSRRAFGAVQFDECYRLSCKSSEAFNMKPARRQRSLNKSKLCQALALRLSDYLESCWIAG